jgi:hypothetical protein
MTANTLLALTVHRPYPYAIVHLQPPHRKGVENRGWRPSPHLIGQRIAIHAGITYSAPGMDELADVLQPLGFEGLFSDLRVQHTGIIGTVMLRGWLTNEGGIPERIQSGFTAWAETQRASRWFRGPIGWLLDEPQALHTPIICKGHQGLWPVPAEHAAEITRQIGGQR